MKKILILFGLLLVACDKTEPIEVIAPTRDIDTESLQKYKSQLNNRLITMGMLYNWGNESGAFLAKTPDSLDVVVVKSGYQNMTEILKSDLKFVQEKKATKVLVGFDFESLYQKYELQKESLISVQKEEKEREWKASNERLTDAEKKRILQDLENKITENLSNSAKQEMETQANDLVQIAKNGGFNGVSIEFPQNLNEAYSVENFDKFLTSVVSQKGDLLLVVENPYAQIGNTDTHPIESASWIVYRQTSGKQLWANFTAQAENWKKFRYLPSIDFTEETLAEGFEDTPNFSPGGRLSRTLDILNWSATNKGGVAYYHIEKNYYEVAGNTSYKTLRKAIGKQQL